MHQLQYHMSLYGPPGVLVTSLVSLLLIVGCEQPAGPLQQRTESKQYSISLNMADTSSGSTMDVDASLRSSTTEVDGRTLDADVGMTYSSGSEPVINTSVMDTEGGWQAVPDRGPPVDPRTFDYGIKPSQQLREGIREFPAEAYAPDTHDYIDDSTDWGDW